MVNSRQSSVHASPNFDTDFCGSIPLNYINHVQPHGILLVIDKDDFTIVQASENVKQILGLNVAERNVK